MTTIADAVSAITAFVGIGVGAYLTYQILAHIKATEFMWFYWGVVIVCSIITAGVSTATREYRLKQEIEKQMKEWRSRQ